MIALSILLVLLVLNALAVVYMLKRRRAILDARDLHARNSARQSFIIARQDELKQLVEDRSRPAGEIRVAADAILAEMLALDVDGALLPLIKDNEAWVDEQLALRQTEPP